MLKKSARARKTTSHRSGYSTDPPQRTERGLLTISTSLPNIAAPALRKRGFAQAKLITDWPAIVGEVLARETLPQKLVFPRGGKSDAVLHLRVALGFALELQHIAPQIIDRVNSFFGYHAVADLRYSQGPIPLQKRPRQVSPPRLSDIDEEKLKGEISDIDDPGLEAALLRLGRAVRNGRQSRRQPGQNPDRESP
jgi:hypothetical protein